MTILRPRPRNEHRGGHPVEAKATAAQQRIKDLEHEVRELRKSNRAGRWRIDIHAVQATARGVCGIASAPQAVDERRNLCGKPSDYRDAGRVQYRRLPTAATCESSGTRDPRHLCRERATQRRRDYASPRTTLAVALPAVTFVNAGRAITAGLERLIQYPAHAQLRTVQRGKSR